MLAPPISELDISDSVRWIEDQHGETVGYPRKLLNFLGWVAKSHPLKLDSWSLCYILGALKLWAAVVDGFEPCHLSPVNHHLVGTMSNRFVWAYACLTFAFGIASAGFAEEQVVAEIQGHVESYVAAYNHRDAQGLAALWSPHATYMVHTTGERVEGREATAAMLETHYQSVEDSRQPLTIDSVRLVTAEKYCNQANEIAQAGTETSSEVWLPLGVFAVIAEEGQTYTDQVVQLALNREGVIRGNFQDMLSNTVTPLTGAVDKPTQRVSMNLECSDSLVVETGLYNLTNDEVPVLIHQGPDHQEGRVLIRL